MTAPTAPNPLPGKWKMLRAELAGEPAHPLLVENTELTLTVDRYSVYYDREIADHGRYFAAASEPHPQLTLHGIDGPNAGRAIPAIYQTKGDLLRICYGLDGSLPTSFTSPPGSQLYLVTYRRQK
jgi:uncharacterized protein (TIGR03067 family)